LTGAPISDSLGLDHFRIGVKGYVDLGGGIKVPAEPSPSQTMLKSDEDPVAFAYTKYFTSERVKVGKIVAGEFVEDSAAGHVLQMEAQLDFDEANDMGGGEHPEFFELGVFESGGTMVLVGTFPSERKTADIQLVNLIRIRF